ncbi:hypothetical protein PENARI_c057G05631 [Penicillium arizonense]|uniref:Hydrophobin n=1 Tax=Penicillium arizonense TaxID=1835702 RepID=A0A1F5L0B3_PENAI|nr:hypothetical protein PENARI_c147G00320 [Penicillium arizonense]XP_022482554.1 hypothetical protein PENARI_c066G03668 [Penicillium arizonense]XP_022482641.1 hypothetical protein PENARI_c057G05631 [Penicillium arizonense]OGE46663.1 hypothetical protein PENARI_c147G00320 [Penicillium arizonense]OGE47088.1 hypothetical protein PENARI_c066G03668 [Penicillium arizonense]OGE47178.1 hypothetical protein PENARI_c057G05631 [Penicillium arizonense]
MYFTVAGLLTLAMAVAATPAAVQVSNNRRSASVPSKQLWHATPEKGVDFNQLQQKCGNLTVSCCNQVNIQNNGNKGVTSGLTTEVLDALAGVLPGYANSACAPASSAADGLIVIITDALTGQPTTPQNFCTGATYACCPGKGGECNAISGAPTASSDST